MIGKIVGFYGTWGSGLAQLQIETDSGLVSIPCDNGPTVRALDALFPGFISRGHTIDNSIIKGQDITYEMDDMGLVLGYISRVTEVSTEMDIDGVTAQDWGKELFEYEYCAECGKDWDEHDYYLVLGHWFAKCRTTEDEIKSGD